MWTYRFLVDGEDEEITVTNAELDLRARAIAVTLRQRVAEGDRALIICPPGLDYLASFLACLYARVIAVPVYPPNPVLLKRTLPRLVGVIEDAQPAIVLAPSSIATMAGQIAEIAPGLGRLTWQAVDEIDPVAGEIWRRPDLRGDDTAFLQYTSGSTGRPKGVILSHANLLANLEVTNQRFIDDPASTTLVTWLPPYHDMGLIGSLLQPLYAGFPAVFMSPVSFLKRPVRWLRTISKYQATLSGAPNFGYELCVSKVTPEERQELDLSSWRLAFSGAEPVRADTIDRFSQVFAESGFRRSSFYPCYGMAEATLFVTGGARQVEPPLRHVQAEALANRRAVDAAPGEEARTLVSCGWPAAGHEVAIVDPDSCARVPDGHIGEIWLSGPSIAEGYWGRPEETEQIFGARIAPTGEGPFLRTGDLGFFENNELFVTGRSKDLIIIGGRNHYPQDIERTVEESHPSLRRDSGVACSVEIDDEERLVVIQEVGGNRRRLDVDGVLSAIRAVIAEEHGLQVHDVVLIKQGGIPKTSSGKLQRSAARKAFLDGDLDVVASWSAAAPQTVATPADNGGAPAAAAATRPAAGNGAGPGVTNGAGPAGGDETRPAATPPADGMPRPELARRLTEELAARLKVGPDTLDPTKPIATYGLQSADMVGMIGDVERWLGRTLSATLVWEYPTIDALADFLSGAPTVAAAGTDDSPRGRIQTREQAGEQLTEAVAIVGIGCRFPGGADSAEDFWRLLREGRDAITEVPADRWDAEAYLDAEGATPGKTTTRWGGFLDGVDRFDPHFFGISPHEAARMDPQQRLLAEVTWEALEDAGVVAEHLAGSATGVFIGIATSDYSQLTFQDLNRIDAYTGTGNAFSIAANRLSYLFDLRGPSMSVDTACSSSLVAVHQACASLAQGDCELAIAGGVNLILSPALAINFSKAGAMAPDGRCKTFDSRADGYVRSEGAGVVILKPLSRAIADRDNIYGVIAGGAVNQDGRTNGLMAPNPHAQEAVLRSAYARAGVRPEHVRYVEAHGTGTLLGDPIEAKALAAVVAAGRGPADPLLIGSVKSNLGHLEAAAGIAGLIKTALILRHRTIPPSLHYVQPNPHIPFTELSLRVTDSLQPWPADDAPAVAGVSSFGFGGTNAHLVLREPPRQSHEDPATGGRPHVLALSARTPEALRELAARYDARLAQSTGEVDLAAICAAAAVRRSHHEQRLACVGGSVAELREALGAFGQGEERPGLSSGGRRVARRPRVAFLFAGQGPRWWPLATDLLDAEPVFRETLEHCDTELRRHGEWSLLDQLTGQADECLLDDPAVAQPALTALQIALAALWRSWGVEPDAVVGHSVGEVAAAHVAGALSLADALRVAWHRGRVIRAAIGQGRMAVVGLALPQTERMLAERQPESVSVAASNGPNSTVLSGDPAALAALAEALEADGVFCRLLESVDYASHSPYMEPLKAKLRTSLTGLQPRPTTVTMISTVTGRPIDGATLDAAYWATNLRQPVLFDGAVTHLVDSGHDTFVEISAHPMLGDAVTERLALQQCDGVAVASLRRDEPGLVSILGELGRLYSAGYGVNWARIHGDSQPMVALPSYPWQRERFWISDEFGRARRTANAGHPILETFVHSAAEPRAYHWSARVDLAGFPYLRDHQVDDVAVLPAALLLDAGLAAARQVLSSAGTIIEGIELTRMTLVEEEAEAESLQLVLLPEATGAGSLQIFSRGPGEAPGAWTQVARGRFRDLGQDPPDQPADPLAEVRERCPQAVESAEHYARLSRSGLRYGPAFQGNASIWRGEHEAVAQLGDPVATDRDPYLVHPALLDAALQVLAAALDGATGTYLPVGVGRFTLDTDRAVPRWVHARIDGAQVGADEISGGRVVLYDADGNRVGGIDGITLQRLDRSQQRDPVGESLLELDWRELTEPPATERQRTDQGWWLLLTDRGGVGDDLRRALAAQGTECVTVTPGARYRRMDADRYEVDPARAADFATLLAELRADRPAPCATVVHAWSLDAALADSDGLEALELARRLTSISTLHLVQALVRAGGDRTPRLALLTRGAQVVGAGAQTPVLAQAELWGLARVITLEHGELHTRIIDLDPSGVTPIDGTILNELLRTDGVEQVALRDGRRYTPRLGPWQPSGEAEALRRQWTFDPATDGNYRILSTRGILDSLTPVLSERALPGPGEVQIEIAAAGLNFSDVLKAMEICPGYPPGIVPLGAECAGRVSAVGEGVRGYRVGDPVMAVAPSSMAAFATTPAELVARIPEGLTDEQAAAVPIAFLTVVYGLEYLAHLGKGERILIHSATGGVGLAALQVARRNGAEVFATAGTEEKRELLRSLGVKHVMDSRSLRFADEIMELTDGRGVDVVLNSLAGEALTRSLSLLARNGRFVEIGKQDIYANSHIGLEMLKQNRMFLAVDLEQTLAERPALIAQLFDEVLRGFDNGEFTALPVTTFAYPNASMAFSLMAQAKHKGKIVLRPDGREKVAVPPGRAPVRPAATYLITGGLGALGLETARYLVDQGARHLALLGRSGPSADAQRVIDELRDRDVTVQVCPADISRYDSVTAVLAELDRSMPPLAGVVHAAGILDDGLLIQLDADRFGSVAAPKSVGAWHLHRATLDRDLDFFILYSSAAALLGSPSQGNYAAANAFLDSLALLRRAQGRSGLSINWGPWSEAGLAARPDRAGSLDMRGILGIRAKDGIEALDRLLRTSTGQASVLPLDRERLQEAAASGLVPALLTDLLAPGATAVAGARQRSGELREKLLAVEPGRRRRNILVQHCATEVARVLKLDVSRVDTTTPLASMGFDSLMSLELRKRLENSLDVELSATIAWRFPTIDALVPFLAERMGIPLEAEHTADEQQPAVEEPSVDDDIERELEELSDSDVEALLLAKITQIDEGRQG